MARSVSQFLSEDSGEWRALDLSCCLGKGMAVVSSFKLPSSLFERYSNSSRISTDHISENRDRQQLSFFSIAIVNE